MMKPADRRGRFLLSLRRSAAILSVLLAADIGFLIVRWPFTSARTIPTWEHFSFSRLQVRTFHLTFFPEPGYVAEGLLFSRLVNGRTVPIATVQRLQCRGSWISMFSLTHSIKELKISGLHITIPETVPEPMRLHPSLKLKTAVKRIIADGAILDLAALDSGRPTLRFEYPKLFLENISPQHPFRFDAVIRTSDPPGQVTTHGTFGPFDTAHAGETPVAGSFQFSGGDLGRYRGVCGTLSMSGDYNGSLQHLPVQARAAVPDFQAKSGAHQVRLTASSEATIDALSGNVVFRSIAAEFLHTRIAASGTISAFGSHHGKVVKLGLEVAGGRVEDLLYLFGKAPQPPLDGPVSLHANLLLPPGSQDFLHRLQLAGHFAIPQGRFSRPAIAQKVEMLSLRARGNKIEKQKVPQDPVTVLLESDATLRNGAATLAHLTFEVPGAVMHGGGVYQILTQKVDLRGTLAMSATLSQATGGFKSLLLKPFNRFFEKNGAGAVLPVRVSGTYSRPVFKLSLTGH